MNDFNNNADNNTNNSGNRGFNSVNLTNCRIAGPATYIPAHTKPGATKPTDAQAKFTVYQNIRNKKMEFRITAWGKMADVIARGGSTGKQIHLQCSIHSYRGRVWLPTPDGAQRQFVTRADGQPLMETKIGFTLEHMNFGVDSSKTIQEEIQSGFRPVGWSDPTQPGYQQWRQICANNNAIQFQPGMTQFGYAKVSQPNGQVVQNNANNNFNQQNQMPNTGAAQQFQQPVAPQQNQNFQQANVGGFQGAAQQPVAPQQNQNNAQYVNGQYVGQAMPNHQNNQQFQTPVQGQAQPVM
jgi:hypothetical protein